MRVIRNSGSSFISVRARNSASDVGVIQKSTTPRVTEIEALESAYMPNRETVTDQPPGDGYLWCSHCGWRKAYHFGENSARKSGYDNYCKECRERIRSSK